MLIDEIKSINTDKEEVRKFGILIAVLLGILGGYPLWKNQPGYLLFFILSGIFLGLSFTFPGLLRPLQKVWMTFAVVMGWFMTKVILCTMFYFVITPLAMTARCFGKDFLGLRATRESYWSDHQVRRKDKSRYEKQF